MKFTGGYHGHADMLLVQAGSGAATLGLPDSPGVPAAVTADTLSCAYNDLSGVEEIFDRQRRKIAAVIVEPVAGNMGVVLPEPGFLQGLRAVTKADGALLIFDEVMTGFRVHPGGAQALYGVVTRPLDPGQGHWGRSARRRLWRTQGHHGTGCAGRADVPGRNPLRESPGHERGDRRP